MNPPDTLPDPTDVDCATPNVDFPGHDKLVAALDRAISAGDDHAITAALRNTLCALIMDRDVQLPACVYDPIDDHYARRELYRSPGLGYSVVAMTWGPGQGTPVHDHCGLWCVEGVWDGQLEITQYELLERQDDRVRFRAAGGMHAGPGSAGSLIPPHEYHAIRNASDDQVAVSVHIYKAPMGTCSMFVPHDGEWFVRQAKVLCTDAAD